MAHRGETGRETGGSAMYDLIITGGRVVDPETGRDGLADVAIKDGPHSGRWDIAG